MYRHGSYVSKDLANPINKLVGYNLSKPAIGYAKVLKEHAVYLWWLAGKYPGCTINSCDNNVSGAFPQLNHQLEISCENVSVYGDKIIVAVALHFGGNYGPSSW